MKLRGNCPAKVDEKGRLKIPPCSGRPERVRKSIFTSPDHGRSGAHLSDKVGLALEDKAGGGIEPEPGKRKFLMRTSYYGQTVELDGQGRVLVPAVAARIGADER